MECDFLVMGADGMGSFVRGEARFGSVTEALIGKSRCHVMVTKEAGKKYSLRTRSEYELGFIGKGADRPVTGEEEDKAGAGASSGAAEGGGGGKGEADKGGVAEEAS